MACNRLCKWGSILWFLIIAALFGKHFECNNFHLFFSFFVLPQTMWHVISTSHYDIHATAMKILISVSNNRKKCTALLWCVTLWIFCVEECQSNVRRERTKKRFKIANRGGTIKKTVLLSVGIFLLNFYFFFLFSLFLSLSISVSLSWRAPFTGLIKQPVGCFCSRRILIYIYYMNTFCRHLKQNVAPLCFNDLSWNNKKYVKRRRKKYNTNAGSNRQIEPYLAANESNVLTLFHIESH